MQKLALVIMLLSLVSCSKDDMNNPPPVTDDCSVAPFKVGTSYTYSYSNGSKSTLKVDKDTSINGKTYFRYPQYNIGTGAFVHYGYFSVSNTGYLYSCYLGENDINETDVIEVKTGQPVGTEWSYTFPSVSSPVTVSYVYSYKILSTTETFSLNSKTYSNGIKVEHTDQDLLNGLPNGPPYITIETYFCGLGVATGSVNGASVILTNYSY